MRQSPPQRNVPAAPVALHASVQVSSKQYSRCSGQAYFQLNPLKTFIWHSSGLDTACLTYDTYALLCRTWSGSLM